MVEGEQPPQDPALPKLEGEQRYTAAPWILREAKGWGLGHKLKILAFVLLAVGACYLMFKWFGWYWMLGLMTGPAWFFWALRQLDRESYLLIEVRLKGDEFIDGHISMDTQTNIYQFPPDLWRETKKFGSPFTPGGRIYICDRVLEDEEGNWTVYFPEDPSLSNMNFFTRVKVWLEVKKQIPKMSRDLAYFKWNLEIVAQERAAKLLEEMGILEQWIEDPYKHGKSYRTVRKTQETEINGQIADHGPGDVGRAPQDHPGPNRY